MVALHAGGVEQGLIAWFVERQRSTVDRWIERYLGGEGLRDRLRSGRPPVFTEAERLKTIAFHCQVSPLPGCNTWSFRWAEAHLAQHPNLLGFTVSRSTIQRILTAHALRPHRHKYFLAITDPDFFPKMDHLIGVYLKPPENLFCYDECTCLQAKAVLAPELPPGPGLPRRDEFEYVRHGTTDLMAFLNPKDGKVFGRCTPNHKTTTFIQIFREHVKTLPPDAFIHYVMDNLSPHYHDDFCRTVADLSHVTYSPLKTGRERRAWLQSEDKRIVVHFTPFHGSWLNMIEIWFGILSRKCIRHQSFPSVQALQETIMAFIETWNESFAHPFSWTYTGKGLQEKAISRFQKILLIESRQMDIKYLTKQMLLMSNIVRLDPTITRTKEWCALRETYTERTTFIHRIIEEDEKERRRKKALDAREQFRGVIN